MESTAEQLSVEAVHKAKNAQQAVELARHVQLQEVAQQITDGISDAVEKGFKAGVDEKRYIDVTRIPLICQSINQLAIDIKEIKDSIKQNNKDSKDNGVTQDQFWPVRTLVYGITALMLTGVVAALLVLVFKH